MGSSPSPHSGLVYLLLFNFLSSTSNKTCPLAASTLISHPPGSSFFFFFLRAAASRFHLHLNSLAPPASLSVKEANCLLNPMKFQHRLRNAVRWRLGRWMSSVAELKPERLRGCRAGLSEFQSKPPEAAGFLLILKCVAHRRIVAATKKNRGV